VTGIDDRQRSGIHTALVLYRSPIGDCRSKMLRNPEPMRFERGGDACYDAGARLLAIQDAEHVVD
jgi:hypothetical protein